jgi:hypothetical protein
LETNFYPEEEAREQEKAGTVVTGKENDNPSAISELYSAADNINNILLPSSP